MMVLFYAALSASLTAALRCGGAAGGRHSIMERRRGEKAIADFVARVTAQGGADSFWSPSPRSNCFWHKPLSARRRRA